MLVGVFCWVPPVIVKPSCEGSSVGVSRVFNQDDLVALRTAASVHKLRPGVTGWAQVNGRDELPIPVKVGFDDEYRRRRSMRMDIHIIFETLRQAVRAKGVSH